MKDNKKYRFSFFVVSVINVGLAVFLLNASFGQISGNNAMNQRPLKVEVTLQSDSPLSIMLINVDDSTLSSQTVNFAVQNIGSKSIRAYTILGKTKASGKLLTNSFATRLFKTGEIEQNGLSFESEIIKENEVLFLSVDYVEFEDGSFWGEDSQGHSKLIAGERAGRLAAINRLKKLVKNNDFATLTDLLGQKIAEISVSVPTSSQPGEWQRGYQRGYKAVISILQRSKEQEIDFLSTKLDEMEQLANEEQKR
ncbi:MAG: hypothetical protein KF762_01185 [Acidobacteria bacterium]|nr:hypothetical protein [Acidobacteriota bacterium]